MDPSKVRAFLDRDFEASARLKELHWATAYRVRGPLATLEASDTLRAHMRLIRPDWPTADERALDLEHHVAQRRLFERIAHGLAGR